MLHIVRMYKNLFFSLIESRFGSAGEKPDYNEIKQIDTEGNGDGMITETEIRHSRNAKLNDELHKKIMKEVKEGGPAGQALLAKYESGALRVIDAYNVACIGVIEQAQLGVQNLKQTVQSGGVDMKAIDAQIARHKLPGGNLKELARFQEMKKNAGTNPNSNPPNGPQRNLSRQQQIQLNESNAFVANAKANGQTAGGQYGFHVRRINDIQKLSGGLTSHVPDNATNLKEGTVVQRNGKEYRSERVGTKITYKENYSMGDINLLLQQFKINGAQHSGEKQQMHNIVMGKVEQIFGDATTMRDLINETMHKGFFKNGLGTQKALKKLGDILTVGTDGDPSNGGDALVKAEELRDIVIKRLLFKHGGKGRAGIHKMRAPKFYAEGTGFGEIKGAMGSKSYNKAYAIAMNHPLLKCFRDNIGTAKKFVNESTALINETRIIAGMEKAVGDIVKRTGCEWDEAVRQYTSRPSASHDNKPITFEKWKNWKRLPADMKKTLIRQTYAICKGEPVCILKEVRVPEEGGGGGDEPTPSGKHGNNESTSTTGSKGKEGEKSNQKSAPSDQKTTETKSSSKSNGGKRK